MDTINLQELAEKAQYVKAHLKEYLSFKTLYPLSQIISTQYLSIRISVLFKSYIGAEDVFIYSCAEDPNICQLTMHKPWKNLIFAWIRPDCTYLFSIPKQDLYSMGLSLNHADSAMIQRNSLFKQSLRLSEQEAHQLSNYLVEIL